MRSRLMTAALAVAAFAASAPKVQAQYYYPPGYGGYGWGGWGGGGTTVAGDTARGMGAFAAGAGYYVEQQAKANAINANTALQWNQYWYEAQQNRNRDYWARMAAEKKSNVKSQEAIYLRLRDNPSKYDVWRGDAMNVVYDQLCNPKIYLRSLPTASAKFHGEMIRDIPFQAATAAITSTVHQVLAKGSAPEPLKSGEAYKAERDELREIAQKIREGGDANGQLDPEMLDRAETLIKALQAKVAENVKAGTRERNDCDRFLKSALGITRMLRTPAINVILSDAANHPEATVGDLLSFMKAYNLRFGVADDPREREVYDALYPLLVKLRDEAYPNSKPEMPKATTPEPPTDFFAGMEDKHLAPNQAPPPPKPAAPK